MNRKPFLMFFLSCAVAVRAAEYHVGPDGSDSASGTAAQPFRTIGHAAALVQPGDRVQIHSGVYREKVAIAQSGTTERPIRFEAAPDATVVITGADQLTGWSEDPDGTYSVPWPHGLFQGDDRNPGGVEQVLCAGVLLRKVASLNALTAGTFFVDLQRQRLHLRAERNPDETRAVCPIEGSLRSEIWIVTGAHIHTRGLRFRYAANRAQQAMAQFRGADAVVEDCIFEWSNSTGASFRAKDVTVRRCLFTDNGQQGFTANHAHRLLFDGCTVQRNNCKNYPRGWEAGGDKLCFCHDAIIQNSRFMNNHGNGVWFDISNVDCTVRNCLIADNEDAGIFYEISYGLHAHDNVVVGNGLTNTKGAWGANGGICISSSPGCVIERNLIIGNQQGFCFREQNRWTTSTNDIKGAEVAVWVHDEVIRNNLIVNNVRGQAQGWFDISTERHWPKAMQTGNTAGGQAQADVAAEFHRSKDGVPPNLSLENLRLALQGNFYALMPGQPFFIWGANWKRKQEFKDLPSLKQALGFEDARSRMLPAIMMDPAKQDFRLPKDHPAIAAGVYPQGHVPDCLLGAR